MTHERSVKYWSQCFTDIKNQPIQAPSLEDTQREPAGRLDRLLGTRLGEIVRHILHRKASPYRTRSGMASYFCAKPNSEETFWEIARAADVEGAGTVHAGDQTPRCRGRSVSVTCRPASRFVFAPTIAAKASTHVELACFTVRYQS